VAHHQGRGSRAGRYSVHQLAWCDLPDEYARIASPATENDRRVFLLRQRFRLSHNNDERIDRWW
jgi:hypothetical protein